MALYDSPQLVEHLITMMNEQRAYLSEIDGAIGDGDHGINMSKGFSQARERMHARPAPPNLPQSLDDLAMTLLEGIGGSMGPLYGGFFLAMSEALEQAGTLDRESFGLALSRGVEAVQEVGSAQVGDKTLIDTLVPARDTYLVAQAAGLSFADCLHDMVNAAQQGQLSTKALQARVGRSARLGERSIGVLDAGATSCYFILKSVADSILASLA